MPKDVSSSSSEDETDHVATETTEQQKEPARKAGRLECPEDFVSFCHVPCSSTLADNLRNNQNELWLIKAPASFDPHCLGGVQVPLSGLQTLEVPVGSDQQSYSVLASSRPTDLRLLTSRSRTSAGFVFAPPFSGLLNVCERYGPGGEPAAAAPGAVLPPPPPPAVPAGLRQRFHPFGSKTPKLTYVAENEADGAAFGPTSATLRPLVMKQFVEDGGLVEEEEEGGRKRRKKKKEKRIKSEEVEVLLQMKREPSDENLDEATEKKKKRRKKKKKEEEEDREVEEEVEPGVKVKEESVSVKCEPLDVLYGDAAESSGKRKKKKKKKSGVEEEVQFS